MPVGALFKHWSLRLFSPDRSLQQTYDAFKTLLAFDSRSHELMAEFEELYHTGRFEDVARIRNRYRHLAEAVLGMISALERMQPGPAAVLRQYFNKYDFYVRLLLAPPEQFLIPPFAIDHETLAEAALTGQKSHALLRVKQAATARVPAGFTITTTTFGLLVEHNRVRPALDILLAGIDPDSTQSLETTSQALMTLVRQLEIPEQVRQAVFAEYERLTAGAAGVPPKVAVRSSALHEDGRHSFAGQYHTVLGVDREGLLPAYLEVLASKYTPQALLYRMHAGLSDEEAAMAVLVLVMVDATASGVVYTRDPLASEGIGSLLIHSIHGLGLPLVGGETVPDVYRFPPQSVYPAHVAPGSQCHKLVLRKGEICQEPMTPEEQQSLSLGGSQAVQLAGIAWELERFFGQAQDIEWALDASQTFTILQSRPLQVETIPPLPENPLDLPEDVPLLTGGQRAAGGIACGRVRQASQMETVAINQGTVLVTRHIPPSLVRYIGKLAAVICEQGSVTGHFATVCREFGVVLLVNAVDAVALLPQGLEVTVDGFTGRVYEGRVASLLDRQRAIESPTASAFSGKLRQLLDHITPLHLLDPDDPDFRPQSCRSIHDIIRYAHEKAVQTMFGLGDIASGASSRCRKLDTALPLDIYLLDVGGAFEVDSMGDIAPEQLRAVPFLALWRGLSHPEIDWQSHPHFDWKGFGDMALSGGVASGGAKDFASYAIVSPDYLNLNMRFGFHFTLVDCLCGEESRANYCQLRFAGGGGDSQGRSTRIILISRILRRLGFEVSLRGDLLDARLDGYPAEELAAVLTEAGRLLGMTKLLDMVLREEDVNACAEQFFLGAGRFAVPAGPRQH